MAIEKCLLVFLLLVLSTRHTTSLFQLRASPQEFSPYLPESVQLDCDYSQAPNSVGQDDSKIVSVDEIRVVKQNASTLAWENIALLSVYSKGVIESSRSDITVSGWVDQDVRHTFLRVNWETGTAKEFGIYRCGVIGVNSLNEFKTETSNEVPISEAKLAPEQALNIAKSEVDELKNELKELKRNTSEEIADLNDAISRLETINNASGTPCPQVCDIPKDLVENITREIYDSVLASVQAVFCSEVTECLATTIASTTGPISTTVVTEPSTTSTTPKSSTTSTTPEPSLGWPAGKYALLKPASGCPTTNGAWKEGYIGYHTESVDPNHDNASDPNHFSQPLFKVINGNHLVYMHFCSHQDDNNIKSQSISVMQSWPPGSYCINRFGGTCPTDFKPGYVDIDEEDRNHHGEVSGTVPDMLFFCCKESPPTSLALLFPTEHPFYLYRYKGSCMDIYGMNATEEFIKFDSENNGNEDSYQNVYHPDGQINDVQFILCYYEPV